MSVAAELSEDIAIGSTSILFDKLRELADAKGGTEKLRELILQLAVQGKLVPQDPEDEPAEVLMDRVRKHIETVSKNKKFIVVDDARCRHKPVIAGWHNAKMSECIELISGQHLKADSYNENKVGHPYFTGPADFGEKHPIAKRWTKETRALALKGDILVTVKGSGVGKTNLLDAPQAFISRQLMAVRVSHLLPAFVHLFFLANFAKLQSESTGIAIPGIGRDDILNLSISIPPLAEQKRIVAKVDELMVLCDQLEQQCEHRQETTQRLLEATVAAVTTEANQAPN